MSFSFCCLTKNELTFSEAPTYNYNADCCEGKRKNKSDVFRSRTADFILNVEFKKNDHKEKATVVIIHLSKQTNKKTQNNPANKLKTGMMMKYKYVKDGLVETIFSHASLCNIF